MKKIIIIFLGLLITGCRTPIEESENFEFYLKIDDSSTLIIHDKKLDEYYTYHDYSENKIDINTLKNQSAFLTDKKRVYNKYDISDDCLIIAANYIDRTTFVPFENSIYGKDKNFIYDCRNGVIETADVETFEPININVEGKVASGKDKNNFFFWNKILTDTMGFSKAYNSWREKQKPNTRL